jgi:hypothetical protein
MPTLINAGKRPVRGTTAARRRLQERRSRIDPVDSRLGMAWAGTVTCLAVPATGHFPGT